MPWRKPHRISNMVRGDEHGVDEKSFAPSNWRGGVGGGVHPGWGIGGGGGHLAYT
jgi:hypothetical protein